MMIKLTRFALATLTALSILTTMFGSVEVHASTTDNTITLAPPECIGFDFRALSDAGYTSEEISIMFEHEVIRLVNEVRAEYGLHSLRLHEGLAEIARLRTEEKIIYNVRGHLSPTTGLEHTAHARAMGLNVVYAGENSARGGRTPQEVFDVWMASSGHRQFILSGHSTSRFTMPLRYIGVGFSFYERTTAWTLWQTCGRPAQ